MARFLAILFLLIPSIAKSQEMNKVDMITEFRDIATLVAAEVLNCGETNKDRVLKFNKLFANFMLFQAETENINLTINDVESWKLKTLMEQYYDVVSAHKDMGCGGINNIINVFDSRMLYAESVYDYYTPYDSL